MSRNEKVNVGQDNKNYGLGRGEISEGIKRDVICNMSSVHLVTEGDKCSKEQNKITV